MLGHYAREFAQDDLDAALDVDATARAVDIAHANGDALDGTRILPELLTELSADVLAVVVIEHDPGDADVRGCLRSGGPTGGSLGRPGNPIREGCSLPNVWRAGARGHSLPGCRSPSPSLQQARRWGRHAAW